MMANSDGPTGRMGAGGPPGMPPPRATATPVIECAACSNEAASVMIVGIDHLNVATLYLCTKHALAVRAGGWSIDVETEPGNGMWITAARG